MDRLTAIRAFIHVVELESFTAASGRMGLTRAAVSKYVSQLEEELGGRLLNRSTRHVSVTESGRLYYERCLEVLHNLEEADSAVSGLSHQPRGTLRVSVPTNFASLHLVPLVARFMRDYPDLKVEMMSSDRYVDLVDEGFDLAIRMVMKEDTDLYARYLTRCRHVIVASPDYLARHPAPKTPAELKQHSCLIYSLIENMKWPFTKDGKDYSVKVKGTFKSNNPDMLVAGVIAGMGITMMPTFMSSAAIRRGEMEVILQDYQTLDLPIYAVYASRRFLPAKIRVFIDYLKEHLTDPPYWDHLLTVRT